MRWYIVKFYLYTVNSKNSFVFVIHFCYENPNKAPFSQVKMQKMNSDIGSWCIALHKTNYTSILKGTEHKTKENKTTEEEDSQFIKDEKQVYYNK